MFGEIDKNIIIYERNSFVAFVPDKPHVSREDGGHIVIGSYNKNYRSRLDFSAEDAKEVMRITMLVSEAMIKGMKKRNVQIDAVNYQENGNWSYLKNKEPIFHIHLYGRVRDSKNQPWGEALRFPNPNSEFYNNFLSFNKDDIKEIKNEIKLIENNDKYNINNW